MKISPFQRKLYQLNEITNCPNTSNLVIKFYIIMNSITILLIMNSIPILLTREIITILLTREEQSSTRRLLEGFLLPLDSTSLQPLRAPNRYWSVPTCYLVGV